MTPYYPLLCCVVLLSGPIAGQSRTGPVSAPQLPNQGVSLLLVGNAPIASLNYHQTLYHFRRLTDQRARGSVEMGLGLGFTPELLGAGKVTFPHHLTINYGSRFFRGEIGYGATNGRRGALFERAGYQPGVITGLRITPTPRLSIRLFTWSTFYRETTYVQDPQFRVLRRETQYIRLFPGLSTIFHIN